MKTALLFLLLSSSLLAAPPSAAEYQKDLFKAIDLNNDGKVTEREFVIAVLYDTFASHADKNGRVSRKDYFKWVKQHPEIDGEKEYALMDPKNKGYIIFADVLRNTIAIEDMETEFRKLDKKRKGYITMKDLPEIEQAETKE